MPKSANVVDQAIGMMAKIEKTRRTAIRELLDLRGKVDTQLAQLGYATGEAAAPSVGRRGHTAASSAPRRRRVFSAATRRKMLKSQQERRKREMQAKLEAAKAAKKVKPAKKGAGKAAPAAGSENAKAE